MLSGCDNLNMLQDIFTIHRWQYQCVGSCRSWQDTQSEMWCSQNDQKHTLLSEWNQWIPQMACLQGERRALLMIRVWLNKMQFQSPCFYYGKARRTFFSFISQTVLSDMSHSLLFITCASLWGPLGKEINHPKWCVNFLHIYVKCHLFRLKNMQLFYYNGTVIKVSMLQTGSEQFWNVLRAIIIIIITASKCLMYFVKCHPSCCAIFCCTFM